MCWFHRFACASFDKLGHAKQRFEIKYFFKSLAMNKLIKAIFILLAPFFIVVPAAADIAVDLGLTPSPVYSLWTNINKTVVVYASMRSTDKAWIKELDSMGVNKFHDKTPENVLELVDRFSAKLSEVDEDGSSDGADTLLEGKLPSLLLSEDNSVTPSLVYLHSGQILVNIAGDILHSPDKPIEISPFFEEYSFLGVTKTPSDVFGLVDLGVRRLDKIIIKQKSGQLTTTGGAK